MGEAFEISIGDDMKLSTVNDFVELQRVRDRALARMLSTTASRVSAPVDIESMAQFMEIARTVDAPIQRDTYADSGISSMLSIEYRGVLFEHFEYKGGGE